MFSTGSISPFSLFSLSFFLMESNDSLLSLIFPSLQPKERAPLVWHCINRPAEKAQELGTQRPFNPNFSLQQASSVIFILTEKHLPHQNTSWDGGISFTFEGVFVEANSGWGEALLSGFTHNYPSKNCEARLSKDNDCRLRRARGAEVILQRQYEDFLVLRAKEHKQDI